MAPQLKLYETPTERRARRREESKKFNVGFNAAFAGRLWVVTKDLEIKRGRRLTRSELAALLRERTKKPVTARLIGRWYRGLASPRNGLMVELAEIFEVKVGWLGWGEGSPKRKDRAVYSHGDTQFSFVDNNGSTIATFSLSPGVELTDKDAVVRNCYELLDILSPETPTLRIVK